MPPPRMHACLQVRNQGSCGCCWAFAGAAVVESRMMIAAGLNSNVSAVQLSVQQTVSWGVHESGTGAGCGTPAAGALLSTHLLSIPHSTKALETD